jgi:predicted DNA-binding transcriptional regulator YafY
MYDPIMRVLTVLEILQARERVSGAELAERLEVNARTVQRYIARLQDLCVPVESVRGVGGYYRLKPGFHLPPLMFTNEEAFAVTLGLRALRHVGLSAFAPAMEGAAAKLGRVMPEAVQENVEIVEDAIALEPGPWSVPASGESLIGIAAAIHARRRVCFEYQSHAGTNSCRNIEPYGVAHLDGRWYVAGYCLLRKAVRTFRLDRISNLEHGKESFQRPSNFNIQRYLQQSMPFVQSVYSIDAWLDLPVAEAQSHFALWRVAVEEENGGTRIQCARERLDMFAAMLLSIGCRIVVRKPEALRRTFTELALRARAAARES